MAYSNEVIDHFENPRNVGSLDKSKDNVGTGLVGAPECFGGETLIHTPIQQYISLEDAYHLGRPINVWSYNIAEERYQFKTARVVHSGKKELYTYTIEGRQIRVTPDHELLTLYNGYCPINQLGDTEFIRGVRAEVGVEGHGDFESAHKLIMICSDIPAEVDDCYTLQVEETNNYIIVTHFDHEYYSGIIAKNCGDVMKLQIEVDENERIIDAKFKTFGCGSAVASSSLATEWVKGVSIDEAFNIKNTDLVESLALPPIKVHCSVLAEDAIKAAIADYRKKKQLKETQNV